MESLWFKDRLKQVGKTQDDLAKAIGRDRTIISRLISGALKFQLDYAGPFADVLDVPSATVLRRAGANITEVLETQTPYGRTLPGEPAAAAGWPAELAPDELFAQLVVDLHDLHEQEGVPLVLRELAQLAYRVFSELPADCADPLAALDAAKQSQRKYLRQHRDNILHPHRR